MKHYNEILNDPMYRAMVKTGKVTRYAYKEMSVIDAKFDLSVVSGITDVPAAEDKGYFEVAIIKTYPKRVSEVGDKQVDVRVISSMCDFEEVWKIQMKFRKDPYKLWFKQLTKEERKEVIE